MCSRNSCGRTRIAARMKSQGGLIQTKSMNIRYVRLANVVCARCASKSLCKPRAKQAGAGSPVGAWQSLVMNANVASLILPYVSCSLIEPGVYPNVASVRLAFLSRYRHWIMFAARTNKALSVHLDQDGHWDERFKQLLMDLRSGRARYEIERYVRCEMTDSFYWDPKDNLDEFYFTISVLPECGRSFARQAVPQVQQAFRMMREWHSGKAIVVYTVDEESRATVRKYCECCFTWETTYHIGTIRFRVSDVKTPLFHGDLERLAAWMMTPEVDEGYDTDQS
jgi:hypothetical protein